ncbi:hypothetical protein M7I_0183 [Glarea lozoyensis 74030]|uniref:Uncharacterized protein n=1 Tax=Glarea lozoyensis (strain ATCC 74030 / MF5533) TaxID=1104152 RepID=H0ECN9_GLAL7|nr:hypothetical protein M7I_0183 [Glarea lozoyensis 74030]
MGSMLRNVEGIVFATTKEKNVQQYNHHKSPDHNSLIADKAFEVASN